MQQDWYVSENYTLLSPVACGEGYGQNPETSQHPLTAVFLVRSRPEKPPTTDSPHGQPLEMSSDLSNRHKDSMNLNLT
jgi:hypothetical protein